MRVTTYRQFRMEVRDDGCYLSRHKSPEDAKAGRDGVEVASGVTLSRARTILRMAGATGPARKPSKREPSPEAGSCVRCGRVAEFRSCDVCGRSEWVTDCGHSAQPVAICGSALGDDTTCSRCETRREAEAVRS